MHATLTEPVIVIKEERAEEAEAKIFIKSFEKESRDDVSLIMSVVVEKFQDENKKTERINVAVSTYQRKTIEILRKIKSPACIIYETQAGQTHELTPPPVKDSELTVRLQRKLAYLPKEHSPTMESIAQNAENVKSFFAHGIFATAANEGDIILDSFAGSGTTAHAVLRLNKEDGGNRRFILIEMEDYAETITAERVWRVIKGYGKDDKKIEGTGGGFSYCTLGPAVFTADGNLNPQVGVEALRQFIWYAETKQKLTKNQSSNPYKLGSHLGVSYYFFYEKDKDTALDYQFLKTIKEKDEQYIIYADTCALSSDFMKCHNIIFKKIPRDISRY
jgi:hypothetical protein